MSSQSIVLLLPKIMGLQWSSLETKKIYLSRNHIFFLFLERLSYTVAKVTRQLTKQNKKKLEVKSHKGAASKSQLGNSSPLKKKDN